MSRPPAEHAYSGFIRNRGTALYFALLLIPFIGIPLLYFSYVPIWDGWAFSRCYLSSAATGSVWCFNHSAVIHTFLFGLTQRIDMGNFQLIYASNLLLGVLGLLCLRALLKKIYGERLSSVNLTLLTFCFGLNPVFLVHVIQPSLDFTLPVYLIMLLFFLFINKLAYAAAAGILLIFTKESGVMLYGVSAFLYVPLMILKGSLWWGDRKKLIASIAVLTVPLLLFVVYTVHESETQIGSSWTAGVRKMLHFYLTDPVIAAQLVSLFVLSFSWIITAFVIANVVFLGARYLKRPRGVGGTPLFSGGYERLYFYLLLIFFTYFLTRIPMWNNPRYMISVAPVLVVLFGDALANLIGRQRLITAILTVVLILLTVSSLRTVDPVSRGVMGTFRFGSHDLLQMTRFEGTGHTYGRDQLVYNFEFAQIHYLTEKIYRIIGKDKLYVIAPKATWAKAFTSIDRESGRRMIYGEGLTNVRMEFSNRLLGSRRFPDELYFIAYPNFEPGNKKQLEQLSYVYDVKEVIPVENDGYSVDVYRMERKSSLR